MLVHFSQANDLEQTMPVLRKIAKNYLCIDWVFKVGGLFRLSFEDIPSCYLKERGKQTQKTSAKEFFVGYFSPCLGFKISSH